MTSINIFGISISVWFFAPVFYFTWVFIGWCVKRLAFYWVHKFTAKTETHVDDIVTQALDTPFTLMVFVWGASALFHFVLPEALGQWGKYVLAASKMATVIAAVIFLDGFFTRIIKAYAPKIDVLKAAQSFTTFILHAFVWGVGLLIILDSLGISITPVIASLGIGSLAVALALQPTLENVFSGVQILLDKPVMPGQFIKLESGEEGYVEKIGWRTTWIRQLPNNTVIIPNKQLANARVINYYYPSKELAVLVNVGVHYSSDLEKVQRVTIEVGEEIMKKVTGGVPEFKPFIRYHTFNSSSIDFTVILRAKEFVDNYLIKHEFIKRLSNRYTKEGIVIPFPIAAINTSQEKAALPG